MFKPTDKPRRQQTSSKTLPVSTRTLPVASLNLADTTPTSPLVNASTPRQASALSLLTPVKVSRASLLVRAASFGRLRRPAPVAEPVTVSAILDRLQSSGGGGSSLLDMTLFLVFHLFKYLGLRCMSEFSAMSEGVSSPA